MALPPNLICPVCKEQHELSTIQVGDPVRTNEPVSQHYEVDGSLVVEDHNVTETPFLCSRGHKFKQVKFAGRPPMIEVVGG